MPITLALLLAQAAAPPAAIQQAEQPAPVAQDSTSPDETAAGRLGTAQQGGGDIVVTARRRAETVQQVPIAISVIGGQALADTGAYNVNRLTRPTDRDLDRSRGRVRASRRRAGSAPRSRAAATSWSPRGDGPRRCSRCRSLSR